MQGRIGEALRRLEDDRLLRGHGLFVADVPAPAGLHCAMVRSPHAHAGFRLTNLDEVAALPGVALVLTGADLEAAGVAPMRCLWPVGTEVPRFAIAREVVRHVGEILAVVVATDSMEAQDAVEALEVEWDVRSPVVDTAAALAEGAPSLHAEAPGNVAFRWTRGERKRVETAFASAPHAVSLTLSNNRLAGVAIEPRALLAAPGPATNRITLHASTQVPHHIRRLVTEQLGWPEGRLRVVAPDVGGGFGYKGKLYPEELIIVFAAARLRMPVRWTATRTESFEADLGGRDHFTQARLAFDRDGTFLAIDVRTRANLGAYMSTFGAAIPSIIYTSLLTGTYLTPAMHAEVIGVYTSTAPTDAYRGAGRPEACYVVERLADLAARALGMDRLAIRRRNLIPAGRMPYRTPSGPTYDSGDLPALLGQAAALSGWDGFEARRAEAAARGRLRGIGVACYIESSGVAPSAFAGSLGARVGFYETATLRVEPDGGVQLLVGTHSHGQGHQTTFAQIVGDRLGIPAASVAVLEGDTDGVPFGTGTFGSRSISVGGSAIRVAADRVVAKACRIAAHAMEAAEADIAFADGQFTVAGTDRSLSFRDVAGLALKAHAFPHGSFEPGLQDTAVYDPPNFAFSNGVHVAEVEIDPETGLTEVVAYTAVDDIGNVINPMIAEGQVHGGVAQGLGQALFEQVRYDQGGQLVTGSLMDYAIPRASDLPLLATRFDESRPCTHNPLGAKGCGEAGAIAAPVAIVSATLHALSVAGVGDVAMPLTPGSIWAALHVAGASG